MKKLLDSIFRLYKMLWILNPFVPQNPKKNRGLRSEFEDRSLNIKEFNK